MKKDHMVSHKFVQFPCASQRTFVLLCRLSDISLVPLYTSFCSTQDSLIMMCCGKDYFWLSLIGLLQVSCFWIPPFKKSILGEAHVYYFNEYSFRSAFLPWSLGTFMTLTFGLFMVSLHSWLIFLTLLSFPFRLLIISAFLHIVSSSSEILMLISFYY